jgi:hypothetical protein
VFKFEPGAVWAYTRVHVARVGGPMLASARFMFSSQEVKNQVRSNLGLQGHTWLQRPLRLDL